MMSPDQLEILVQKYSSLTRTMITLGFDAVRGVKALIGTFHHELSTDEQDAILAAVTANSDMRQAEASAAAGDAPTE
jgi:hypothetical protein